MKRSLFILILIALTSSLVIQAASPQWLALDRIGSGMTVFEESSKSGLAIKTEPQPFALQTLPDHSGYALLYLGDKSAFGAIKQPGGIIILDNRFKPTDKISFSGLVVNDYFQNDSKLWFIFTSDGSKNNALNIYDLQKGSSQKISLNSIPYFYKFQGRDKLAVTTAGNSASNVLPELVLLDLNTLQTDHYPVSSNPGAIFFIGQDKLLVACGGVRSKSILSFINTSEDNPSEEAVLHLIDHSQKTIKKFQAGYSPIAIVQDHSKADTFYFTSSTKANSADPAGTLQVLTGETITSKSVINAEPVFLAQTATGNLCAYDKDEFFVFDQTGKLINQLHHDMQIDEFYLNQNGQNGYLTASSSNYLEVINLSTGTIQTKFKLSKGGMLGSFKLGNLIPKSFAPVIGTPDKLKPLSKNITRNNRMIMDNDSHTMYALSNNSEVSVIDLSTNEVKKTIKFTGIPYGIHATPNSKYIVVATETYWHLIDPSTSKPVLSVLITNEEDKYAPQTGYYSPDGARLAIPFEKTIYVVDTENGKLIKKVHSRAENPIVVWPQ